MYYAYTYRLRELLRNMHTLGDINGIYLLGLQT